ncbi:NAD-dependent epimerase/dehydratase family protein [Corynebacterium variabile]|uniref:NAD-dependent epimerase/dehydratase family protein n=1 Tax=Corynebacterium variabile TaxID=1727 RepID=UPI0028AAF8CF|nr:NAD-dependent epimerase/dehydratase family protein [Corynebacterium variabile]
MRYLVTGAGQIGTQLTRDLVAAGHHVTVIRRGADAPDGADLMRGDAGDRDLLRRAVTGGSGSGPAAEPVAGVFHCIHTSSDARAWATDLPDREQAVMDVAAEAGVPVVFPESVYAFGTVAQDLDDGTVEGAVRGDVEPASPLGEIRVNLLAARAAHPARTLSVVAADLIGPTADPASSAFHLLVLGPAAAGQRVWMLGDPDVPRSVTWIPDLTAAMVSAAEHAGELAPRGTAVLLAPTALTMTQRQMAEAVAPDGRARVSHIPWWILRVAGVFSPMMRELRRQRYLWDAPAVLRPGHLEERYGLRPTAQKDVLTRSHWSHS